MITLYFDTKENLYEQIYKYFRDEIREQRIQPGDRLPSSRALAQHLGVSLNTIKLAYDQLLDEGYIISKERSGFYVDKLSPQDLPKEPQSPRPFSPPQTKSFKHNFSYSSVDTCKMPLSILKKSAQHSVEKSAKLGRAPKGGLWSLRKEVAKYLGNRRGLITSAENILITSGYSEHLLILMALIDKAFFAMENPGYQKNREIFRSAGKDIVAIPIDSYGLSVKDLEKTQANVAIVTPNHQFPTGIIMGLRRRQRLLAWAGASGERYIVEDDYDSDFKYSGKPIPALKSLDTKDQVILSGSFSQSIGPFLGISYLVLTDTLRERWEKVDLPLSGASLFQQYTLESFLSSGAFEKHINRMNTHYRNKRNKLLKRLKKEEGLEVLGADAGLHLIIRMDQSKWNREDFSKKTEQRGIYVKQIKEYCTDGWPYYDIILGFGGIPMDQIEEALDELLSTLGQN